ncbi:MAG: hypothetical protein ACU85E_03180 [Gammaproteobacteria bacterium]
MTARKRGLSRGLEELLKADSVEGLKQALKARPVEPDPDSDSDSSSPLTLERALDLQKNGRGEFEPLPGTQRRLPEQKGQHKAYEVIQDVDAQSALVLALFDHIRKENLMLLEEAEALKGLIEEFEQIVRRL